MAPVFLGSGLLLQVLLKLLLQQLLLLLSAECLYNFSVFFIVLYRRGVRPSLASGLVHLAHAWIFTKSTREPEAAPREILDRPSPRERVVFAGNNAIWRIPAKRSVFLCFAFCYGKVTIRDILENVFIYAPIKISPCASFALSLQGRNLYRRMLNVCGAGCDS